MWFGRILFGEVLIRRNIANSVECCCCNARVYETFNYLFIECTDAKFIWKLFSEAAGLHINVIQLKQGLEELWNIYCAAKLKPILKAVPAFIIWVIWKRRNVIKMGERLIDIP